MNDFAIVAEFMKLACRSIHEAAMVEHAWSCYRSMQ